MDDEKVCMIIFGLMTGLIIGGVIGIFVYESDAWDGEIVLGGERFVRVSAEQEDFKEILKEDLLFYHDTNRGLHFLDDGGCEWRIVIEPATAYVNYNEEYRRRC